MKILVAVKRVVDAKIKVRPLPDHSGVDVKLAKMAMNPFDEIAIEKAVTLREAGVADEVVAVTVGPLKAVDTLRVAMAIGADRAVHVRTDESLEPLAVAKVLRAVATVYTEVIRDTPLLLQLYFFYFLLPDILPALKLSKFACITIALVINSGAYMSEVFRSGIQSIDRGQTEAARSLGLSARQTMMRIILPQAFKNVLPAMCNEFVAVTKETSLASTFYVGDLMTQYQTISGKTYLVIEPLVIIGVIYFVVTFSMSKLITVLERRLKNDD